MAVVEARPVAFQGDLRNLTKALAPLEALPNWVCWKWNWKVRRNGVGKWDKPPYQPTRPENFARNNDPTTWGTYKQALAIFEGGGCDGIGFNLSRTEFGAFDIDNCRDKDTGVIAPEALVIVDQAASYTEVTVSGTGLRVIGFGKGSKLHRRQRISSSTVEVETYRNAERYIVITGNPLPGVCLQLSNIDIALDAVVADLDAGNIDRELSASRHIGTTNFSLPQGLSELIDNGVPAHQDLSAAFHRAVCWLHDLGFSLAQIEGRISGKPIVPPRFADRLVGEISRCVNKAKPFREGILHQGIFEQHDQTCAGRSSTKPPLEILWHGQQDRRTSRPWRVKDLIPERGQGLASGQWGAAKTFAMIALCSSIITALPFAGREVVRQGGVLFIAAEGAAEIPIRLQGVVDHKIRGAALAASAGNFAVLPDLDKLPFAWIEEDPSLRDDMERINAASHFAACKIREQFDLPLVLIIVDTLNAVARFKDGNDAAEGQFVMNQLNSLSRATGAFVLAVDHFGLRPVNDG